MQTSVLNMVKRHKVISALELTYYLPSYTQYRIQEALDWLISKRFIILSTGSYPKRYKMKEIKGHKNEDDLE